MRTELEKLAESIGKMGHEKHAVKIKKLGAKPTYIGDSDIKVQDIVDMESDIYPGGFQYLGYAETEEDIADYAEAPTKDLFLAGEPGKWYLIAAQHGNVLEIIDLAGYRGRTPIFWVLKQINSLKEKGIEYISFDARHSTSYELFKAIAKRKGLQWQEMGTHYLGRELMHEIVIKI